MEQIEKLTEELIALILLSSNDPCERLELYDYVIRSMYRAKLDYAIDQTGDTESPEGSRIN